MHLMRDLETHRKNTWLWAEWGFTEGLKHNVSLSDVDGFFCHFLATGSKFLMVEMKHWDGLGECPRINRLSGQAMALRQLSDQRNFTVIIGYGDTSTQTVHFAEVWNNGNTYESTDFKGELSKWWEWATNA